MARGYRYSLVYISPIGEEISLSQVRKTKTGEVIRKKFPLTQIDAFTTRLKGEEELRTVFEYLSKERLIGGKFWVEYTQDKKPKRMRVVYSDDENLAYFSNENIGKTYIESTYKYETYVKNLLYTFKIDRPLYNYLKQKKYINKYITNKIDECLNAYEYGSEDIIKFTYRKISEALTNYKIIRNIEDGILEYKKRGEIKYNENPFNNDKEVEKGYQYRLF